MKHLPSFSHDSLKTDCTLTTRDDWSHMPCFSTTDWQDLFHFKADSTGVVIKHRSKVIKAVIKYEKCVWVYREEDHIFRSRNMWLLVAKLF